MNSENNYEILTGDSIVLSKAKESDWQSMLTRVWSDGEVYKWMLFQPTLTAEDAIERCRRSIAFQKDHFAWFVAVKSTDEAIGLCAMRDNGDGHWEECGICIGKAFQGRGYGKEILSLLLDLSFNKLGAEDFRYGFFTDNEKSKKLAEKFGFVFDRFEDMTRPWDGARKKIVSCLLSKEKYLSLGK